jgi:phage terminase large subunit-like protein
LLAVTYSPEQARAELERRKAYKFAKYFPDCLPGCVAGSPRTADHVIREGDQTPICRVLYVKHLAFMDGGRTYPERLFLAANRIGKTEAAAYETTCHMTGRYPHWWTGKRFEQPGDWWFAGTTSKTTRDVIQVALFGELDRVGTGMIPKHLIADKSAKSGLPDGIESFWIEHVERDHGAPLSSMGQFKSYEQGRKAFEGAKKLGVWFDEEPPEVGIVSEALLRLMTTDGIFLLTFTPIQGLTPVVLDWLDQADLLTDSGITDAKTGIWKSDQENP